MFREVSDSIPQVLALEIKRVLNEVGITGPVTDDIRVALIIDGTPHVAEAFGVVIRFV